MRKSLEDYLFARGYLASDGRAGEHAAAALAALGKLFNIRVVAHPELACEDMVHIAARNLGQVVPLPFYQGFPATVRELSVSELVLDQLAHYAATYGRGEVSQAGRSLLEGDFERECLSEETPVRELAIVGPDEAQALLVGYAEDLLASTRPLGEAQYRMVLAVVAEFGYEVRSCANKDTAARLLLDTRDVSLARLLRLPDVLRVVELLCLWGRGGQGLRKLSLRNRDRRLVVALIDGLPCGPAEVDVCHERRKDWCGLLHHVHYRPKDPERQAFADAMRGGPNRSAYAAFERLLKDGDACGAARELARRKGAGAVLRRLDHLLSRCAGTGEVAQVLDVALPEATGARGRVILVQLLHHYANYAARGPRTFAFQSLGMMRVHVETGEEAARRRSALSADVLAQLCGRLRQALAASCAGTLGSVYVDEGMRRVALPLKASVGMDGVGVLACGTRVALEPGKVVRAFTYWEGVDDIDLSAQALAYDGTQVEFSWRNMAGRQSDALCFSGDQTSGYHGGSEYFDVDVAALRERAPHLHYLVFCNNVFSRANFDQCLCTAGYMLRKAPGSGEPFEPKTVRSSYAVTCPSSFAYLFALDLERNEFVWLNVARSGHERVAGRASLAHVVPLIRSTEVLSVYDFARMLAREVVDDPREADVVFSDQDVEARPGAEVVRGGDMGRLLALLGS